jgi:hypothetical protein
MDGRRSVGTTVDIPLLRAEPGKYAGAEQVVSPGAVPAHELDEGALKIVKRMALLTGLGDAPMPLQFGVSSASMYSQQLDDFGR